MYCLNLILLFGDCKSPAACFGIANPEEQGMSDRLRLSFAAATKWTWLLVIAHAYNSLFKLSDFHYKRRRLSEKINYFTSEW